MGIRLDWESDSARSGNKDGSYVAREDPEQKRARVRARTRFLLTLIIVVMLLGGIGLIVTWRLNEANAFIESLLRDTVESEFAALRIGDWNAFAAVQRSATDDWTVQQRTVFNDVQQRKQQSKIELTGTVRDLQIDGTRGRVMIEWIEDSVPVTRAWFYWRYEDGWRHVPADLTFWGEAAELRGNRVTVAHRMVDAPLAKEMGVRVEGWISAVCGPILQCGDVPHMTLEVRPDLYLTTGWDNTQPWRLLIPSPYVNGARTDEPFSGDTLIGVAEAIAARLVSLSLGTTLPFDRTTDAGYLVSSSTRWLLGQYIGLDAGATVIESLAATRGPAIIGQLLKSLTPDSTLQSILDLINMTGPAGSGIDWSDFVRVRIQLESDLITQGLTDGVASLYIEEMRSRALERTQAAAAQNGVEVTMVQSVTAPDGSPALIASVIFGRGPEAREESVYFYWRNGTWLRAS